MMKTAEDIALLAPVPLEHLKSGGTMKGRVAFGSRAYEIFLKLEELRGDDDVDVYIYASHAGGLHDAEVSWHARYVGFIRSESGLHPNPKHRPESTFTDTPDSAVFWEVEDLEPLEPPIWIGTLKGLGKKKPYGHQFPPHGPVLIEHP
jgi:hypothetical protein